MKRIDIPRSDICAFEETNRSYYILKSKTSENSYMMAFDGESEDDMMLLCFKDIDSVNEFMIMYDISSSEYEVEFIKGETLN